MAARPNTSVLGATSRGLALIAEISGQFGPITVWEPDPDIGRPARNAAGVAAVTADLATTVSDAAVVICTVPQRDVETTLTAVGPLLRNGAIVIILTVGHEWTHAIASQAIPSHASIACITWFAPPPDVSPRHPKAPRARVVAGISPAVGAHPDAVGVVQMVIEASGAECFFGEAREIDGFAAVAHAVPAVVSAAVVRSTITPRSSRDLDRLGGAPLAALTSALDTDVPTPAELAAVGDHVARMLRTIAEDLHEIASQLDAAQVDPAFVERAVERRRAWLAARAQPNDTLALDDATRIPPVAPRRRRLFF
mgnify:FL=1